MTFTPLPTMQGWGHPQSWWIQQSKWWCPGPLSRRSRL